MPSVLDSIDLGPVEGAGILSMGREGCLISFKAEPHLPPFFLPRPSRAMASLMSFSVLLTLNALLSWDILLTHLTYSQVAEHDRCDRSVLVSTSVRQTLLLGPDGFYFGLQVVLLDSKLPDFGTQPVSIFPSSSSKPVILHFSCMSGSSRGKQRGH